MRRKSYKDQILITSMRVYFHKIGINYDLFDYDINLVTFSGTLTLYTFYRIDKDYIKTITNKINQLTYDIYFDTLSFLSTNKSE